eukprot:GHVU01065617.1.p1 GENE.GHVU01065617.1~~GHVU01065617.1.p1  ORF type:complete len:166 (-),score=38.21 GHVU01065617.1:156-653(-)
MKDSTTGKVIVHGKEGTKLIMTQEVITFYDSNENLLNEFPMEKALLSPPLIGDDGLTDATIPFTDDEQTRYPATDLRDGQRGSGAPSFVEIPRALLFDQQREHNHQEKEKEKHREVIGGDRVHTHNVLHREEKQRQIRTDQDQKDDGGRIRHEHPHAAFQRNGRQ